jgi:hypothetical protein
MADSGDEESAIPTDDEIAADEIAAAERAATDVEQRYQQRERGMRSAAREVDAAMEHAEAERLNPPMLYRAGDGPVEQQIAGLARKIHASGVTPSSLAIGQSFAMYGRWRVYFNRHQAAPLVWCVASDHFEFAVADLVIEVPVRTVYQPKAMPDDEDGKPSAWLEFEGTLLIDANSRTARIV